MASFKIPTLWDIMGIAMMKQMGYTVFYNIAQGEAWKNTFRNPESQKLRYWVCLNKLWMVWNFLTKMVNISISRDYSSWSYPLKYIFDWMEKHQNWWFWSSQRKFREYDELYWNLRIFCTISICCFRRSLIQLQLWCVEWRGYTLWNADRKNAFQECK